MKNILLLACLLALSGCISSPAKQAGGASIYRYWRIVQIPARANEPAVYVTGSNSHVHFPGKSIQGTSVPARIRRCHDAKSVECELGVVSIDFSSQLTSTFEGGVTLDYRSTTTIAPYYHRVFASGGSSTSVSLGDPNDQAGLRDHWEDSSAQRLIYGQVLRVSSRNDVEVFLCAQPAPLLVGGPFCPQNLALPQPH
ncbi:hypothetical protein [Stenotrophomonas pavanii]|uniref:hypothetical protein n=1 Tax=Stenotrophomonas pavanii TaxID=487698 RepID=UPI0039C6AC9F